MKSEVKPSDIDPTAQYHVKLNRRIEVGLLKLNPRNANMVSGEVLLTILDAVDAYEPVE